MKLFYVIMHVLRLQFLNVKTIVRKRNNDRYNKLTYVSNNTITIEYR